jgi:DNA-binding transcriptional LysR family regulator
LSEAVLWFVVSPKHPLAHRKILAVEQLQGLPFVAGLSGTGHATMVQRILNNIGIQNYDIAVRIGTYEGVKRLVCEGYGISILPEFAVHEEIKQKRLIRLKLSTQLKTSVFLVHRPNRVQTAAISFVENFIEKSISRGKVKSVK